MGTEPGEASGAADPGQGQGGVVLCRAGAHRLAFYARQVAVIELWAKGSRPVPHARAAFALPVESGRLLMADGGFGVVVDAIEVAPEPPPLLPPPLMLVGGAGGALRGFLSIGQELWPVLQLPEFSRFLSAKSPEGAAA